MCVFVVRTCASMELVKKKTKYTLYSEIKYMSLALIFTYIYIYMKFNGIFLARTR